MCGYGFGPFRLVIAEMVKIEPAVIAHPSSVTIGNGAAVKIPISCIIARIKYDGNVPKQHEGILNELLVDKITGAVVYEALSIQFVLPPLEKSVDIVTSSKPDKTEIEYSAQHDMGIIGFAAVVREVRVKMRGQDDIMKI